MPTAVEDKIDAQKSTVRRIRAKVRATPDVGEGTFESTVSVFGVKYDIGYYWSEIILAGAFDDSIAAQTAIPINWQHDWMKGPIGDGVPSVVGDSLVVKGQLYLDLDPLVQRIWRSMKAEAVREWSIGYLAEKLSWTDDDPDCDQIEVGDLIEASVVYRGAHPDTETNDLRSITIGEGPEDAKREVIRIRSLFNLPELREEAGETVPPEPDQNEVTPDASPAAVGFAAARAVGRLKSMKRRLEERVRAATDDEADSDPAELAQALDALVDEIDAALEAGDMKGAQDLVVAADSTSDDLLEALGVPDDDGLEADDEDESSMAERAMAEETELRALARTRAGWELIRARAAASTPAPSPTTEIPGGPDA